MNRAEFIKFILTKKSLNPEVFKLSKDIKNFPMAFEFLKAIEGNDFIKTILNPKQYGEIDLAKGDLKRFNLFTKDKKHLNQDLIQFIDELVAESKINFTIKTNKKEKSNDNIPDSKGKVIGIDLGTTYTLASIIENGVATAIPMVNGNRMLPSIISINKNNKFDVGQIAKSQQIANPKETFFSIKRFIGRRSREISAIILEKYPFNVDLNNEKLGVYSERLNKRFECEELSAQLLLSIKSNAERYLDQRINECVITVPAYFDHNQRLCTKKAAEIAGLKVKRLISEPTAAAFAYQISKDAKNSNALVVDLGGGTFDISLVRSSGSNVDAFNVISTFGDRDLGGDDYTNALIDLINESIKVAQDLVDLNLSVQNLIREEATKAKQALSFQEEVEVSFPILPTINNEITSHSLLISRKDFENCSKEITKRIEKTIKTFIETDKVKKNFISKVICVGGASRMPLFQKLIRRLTKLKPQVDINPDEVVSHGAAYCAEYTLGSIIEKTIIDVTPLSLGVKSLGDIFSVLIPANTSLPTRKSDEYTTCDDFQQNVGINIFQGNRKIASDNIFLNSFILSNIQKAKSGIPKINVSFQIDIDGILKVTAIDLITKSEQSIEIKNSLDLSFDEIEEMKKLALEMTNEDIEKTRYSEKVKNLYALRQSYKFEIQNLTDNNRRILDRIDECIENVHSSGEDPDELILCLKNIIKNNNLKNED
tara:strand:- start:4263 stop:6395 length:2133 start_codon:yes stop_codon:yes gene_type:complete